MKIFSPAQSLHGRPHATTAHPENSRLGTPILKSLCCQNPADMERTRLQGTDLSLEIAIAANFHMCMKSIVCERGNDISQEKPKICSQTIRSPGSSLLTTSQPTLTTPRMAPRGVQRAMYPMQLTTIGRKIRRPEMSK